MTNTDTDTQAMTDEEVATREAALAAAAERDRLVEEHRRAAVIADYQRSMAAIAPLLITLFNQTGAVCSAWNTEQGFWQSNNFGEKLALIHSEISEALEAHRKNLPSDHIQGFHGVEEELADAMIRIFDLAAKYNVRLGEAFVAKFNYNLTRPFKHGKAY